MIIDWLDCLIDRLLRRYGGLELLQLLLLFFALECAAHGLTLMIARLSSGFMLMLVFAGVLIAWWLTRTHLPVWSYALSGVLLGVPGLGLTVGGIGRVLFGFISSLFRVPGQLFQKNPADSFGVAASWGALGDALTTLAARFANWFRGVSAGTLVTDPLVTSILWGMLFWLIVFWGLWWVRRRASVLIGLLPAAALLAFNIFITDSKGGIPWLVLAAGGILALQACAGFGKARQRWSASRMQSSGIESRLIFPVMLLVVGMMLAGSLLPSIPVQKIADFLDTLIHPPANQNLAESLGIEQTPIGGTPPGATPSPLIASGVEIHSIGAGPEVDRSVVMYVSVDGYNPPPVNEYSNVISQRTLHYYWRGRIYDRYNNHLWVADTARAVELAADGAVRPEAYSSSLPPNLKLVTQQVIRIRSGDQTVFSAGELLSLDQPSILLKLNNSEIISVQTEPDRYTAISRIPSPSVEGLRAAGSDYPASIQRYLKLPETVPQRVLDLALNLTADQLTLYDKAARLETYLRQFPYSLEVPAPPVNHDAVDYFLFDLKMGYCDYFASAMVVMARASGLPARLVLGYSEGVYDEVDKHFVVRASDAHAWVEIYFPGIGWVEFEPTPNLPSPFRPGQTPETSRMENLPPPGQEAPLNIQLWLTRLGRVILKLLAVLVVLLLLAFLPWEKWWLTLLPSERALKAIFERLYKRGRAFGIPADGSRTPNEFALALSSAVEPLTADEKNVPLIACLRADLDSLTGIYTRLLFSDHPLENEEKEVAIQTWSRLRRALGRVRRQES